MFYCHGDDHPCNVKGMSTVLIKMDERIVRKLKKVSYVPQLKRNLISVDSLKTLGLVASIRDGVLKMTKGLLVVMKASTGTISTT